MNKNLGPDFDTTLGPDIDSQTPQPWTRHRLYSIHLCAVRLGSGPILAILKVRLWPNLMVGFWPKMIQPMFVVVSGQFFFVHQLVLCVFSFADCYQPDL